MKLFIYMKYIRKPYKYIREHFSQKMKISMGKTIAHPDVQMGPSGRPDVVFNGRIFYCLTNG